MLGRGLKKFHSEHGLPKTMQFLSEGIATKKIDPYDFVLPELVSAFLGDSYYAAETKLKALREGKAHLLEDTAAMDASAFSNITGQLLVTIVKDKYNDAEFIADQLVKKYPNPGGNLKEHKVPYLSNVVQKGEKLSQQEPYPKSEFRESWITMPAPEKYGQICAITMEMLFSDLTGQAQDSAASVGSALGYLKEQRVLRVVLGITNPYKFNDTTMNTYLSTANATGLYVNRVAANTISTYDEINTVEQLFYRMVDPITGRRILSRPKAVLCTPEKRYDLKRVLNATEVRGATSGTHNVSPNPLDTIYPVLSSSIAQALLDDETNLTAGEIKQYCVFADFSKAFGYREVYPLKVVQAPALNPDEFNQDIVLSVKASEFGVPFVYDPRYACLSTSEAS